MAMQPATSNDDRGQSVGAFPQRRLLPKTGQQTISWTIQDPDSTSFTSMILYSPDNGADWSQLGQVGSDTSLTLDFGTVPGSNRATALIQVLVSDGINTGSATTAPFTVPRKNPTVVLINSPQEGFSQAAIDPILLVGSAYDPDDGVLTGASLQWSSNLQGALGTGSPLSTTLQPGAHKITLTATDSDGNAISTYVDVVIGGGRPVLSITSNQCQVIAQAQPSRPHRA